MLKIVSIGILSLVLSSGCLATKMLIPGGEPLTTTESTQLETIKETVGVVSEGVNGVLMAEGGGAVAIITALGALYWKRKRKNG